MTPTPDVLERVPEIVPSLDPGFRSIALGNRSYARAVAASREREPLVLALEREAGLVTVHRVEVLPVDGVHGAATRRYVERLVKFLLWQAGGWRLSVCGSPALGRHVAEVYRHGGARAFDVQLMETVYGRPFEVVSVPAGEAPSAREASVALGGYLDGCRIGFDLGASDYKLAAVRNGEVVFTTELPWDPKHQADPEYHRQKIEDGLRLAAGYLPRVDAIGGSAAGIYLGNEVRVASLFRSVAPAAFAAKVKPMFLEMGRSWGVPFEVANDGEVTALAGGMSLGVAGLLGIAMGSSEAAGYLDRHGRITGWLNELAFAPVDYGVEAPADEWSGDVGVGALYFSQQAVGRLLKPAGIQLEPETPLPERLKFVQSLMASGDGRAERIYQTLGVYLGHALAQYRQMYDFEHVLVLGRVTTGPGAEIMVRQAQAVLAREFADCAGQICVHVPDEASKRVGQAVAAASLPRLSREGNP